MMSKAKWLTVVLCTVLASSAASAGSEPESDFFTASDDVKIHYYTMGDSGPWVVLIHGYMDTARRMWISTGIAGALAENHRVMALDNRNHGKSDKHKSESRPKPAKPTKPSRGKSDKGDKSKSDKSKSENRTKPAKTASANSGSRATLSRPVTPSRVNIRPTSRSTTPAISTRPSSPTPPSHTHSRAGLQLDNLRPHEAQEHS